MMTPWLKCPQPRAQARLRLFCFPYAGGNASVFRAWPAALPEIEVWTVELPGRGDRFNEPAFSQLSPLLQSLRAALRLYLDLPFALFGHSMGALLSYELARHLRQAGEALPWHLFVSGWRAPQLPDRTPPIHQLPEAAFAAALRDYNGTPEAVLQNTELRELLFPTLRADFAIAETYLYTPGTPLPCPISAFGGLQDQTVSREELSAWQDQTEGRFTLRILPGNHFFLNKAQTLLLPAISQDLRRTLSQTPAGF
jgi:medium-chain acyl-[acyl-carrier-protein] hydrolase